MHSAVLLDRDGVIVQDVGYLTDPDELVLLPGAAKGIRKLQRHYRMIVVTNQSAIARGLLDLDGLDAIHRVLIQMLSGQGAYVDAIYACPHRPEDECLCRKPQPGMLFQARNDLGIDLRTSYLVGDKASDLVAGQRAGVKAIVLIPSHQTRVLLNPSVHSNFIAKDLREASEFVLNACSG